MKCLVLGSLLPTKFVFHTSLSQNFSFGVPRSPIKHRQGFPALLVVRVGGGGGGAYLRFGTFDHVRASFFKFLVL